MRVNNMDISFPHQLFINNEFMDSESGNTFKTINPHDESVICEIAKASVADTDVAVAAAKVSSMLSRQFFFIKSELCF